MSSPTAETPPQPRVVLDTNVSLALWLFEDPTLHKLRAELESGQLLWVATTPMLDELWHEALRPDRLQRLGVTEVWLRNVVAAIPCELVGDNAWDVAHLQALRCTDPADQVFIDVALAHRVSWLLSRDKAVLKLYKKARSLGLVICTPERWLLTRQVVDS